MKHAWPPDWTAEKIGDRFDFTSKPSGLRLQDQDAVAFIPMELVPTHSLWAKDFNLKKPSEIASGTYFEEGDLLVPKITPCFENGKQGIAQGIPGGFGVASTEIIPIKAMPGESNVEFLAYYLLDSEVRASLADKMEGTTGRQRLSKSSLQEWVMPFPPIPEQQSIASVLAKVQASIETQRRIVATLKELKAATMAKLFREGTRGERLKQTEIGEMPESWEVVNLGEVLELKRGFDLPSQDRRPGNVPIVSSSGITGTHVKAMVRGPGVVTGRYGTLGQVYYLEEDFWPLNTSLYVRDFKGNDPLFTCYLLQTLEYGGHNDKSAVPGVNRNSLHIIPVGKPHLEEQKGIAATLRLIDSRVEIQAEILEKRQALFSAMLHLLMTGQVRVTPQMIEEVCS